MPVMNKHTQASKDMGSVVGSERGMDSQDLLEGDMREFDVSVQVFAYCSPHRKILRQAARGRAVAKGQAEGPSYLR